MVARDFREHAFRLSPIFLRFHYGERLVGGIALLADILADGLQRGVLSRFIGAPGLAPDAPALIGASRLMPQYPAEADANYRRRLQTAWQAWLLAGTIGGILLQLERFGGSGTIVSNYAWDWDGQADNWSRFWLIVESHPWTDEGTWGDGQVWGDGGTWGSTMSFAEMESLRQLVRQWKPAHVVCDSIIVVLDSGEWSGTPTGDWDHWENRDTGAIYVSG